MINTYNYPAKFNRRAGRDGEALFVNDPEGFTGFLVIWITL
jgi:hypothetical protein